MKLCLCPKRDMFDELDKNCQFNYLKKHLTKPVYGCLEEERIKFGVSLSVAVFGELDNQNKPLLSSTKLVTIPYTPTIHIQSMKRCPSISNYIS